MKQRTLNFAVAWAALAMAARTEELPRVLIIGDSISIGYTPTVQRLLKGHAIVEHNPGNAAHSRNGLARLEDWLGTSRWDVIHFNFGLQDLKYVTPDGNNAMHRGEGRRQVDLPEYASNIEAIGRRLVTTGARVIFATTTPYPDGTRPYRDPADWPLYNEAALKALEPLKIEISDLAAIALPNLAAWQKPVNVHFTDEGSNKLGEAVARSVWRALGRDPAALPQPASPSP